jgi:adenosylhomocysteine nucleosidase
MLLIFCAFRRELAALNRRLLDRVSLPRGLAGTQGTLNGEQAALVATGIGPRQATAATLQALELLPPPRLILTAGVAGALRPDLQPGTLILADNLILDSPDSASLRQTLHLNDELVAGAEEALRGGGLDFARGALLTSYRILAAAAQKRVAQERTGALAVDMESAAVAAALTPSQRQILLCLRAILDRADDELIGGGFTDAGGAVVPLKAAAFFATHPTALARMPALIRNLSRATTSLARGLEALCAAAPGRPGAPAQRSRRAGTA